MKNKNIKIVALLIIAAVGIFALSTTKKSSNNSVLTDNASNPKTLEDNLTNASSEKPFVFDKKTENPDVFLSFSYNGKEYVKQLTGPTVRSTPTVITKEEFENEYSKYLL